MVLARISHQPPAAFAAMLAVTGLTPYGRLDSVQKYSIGILCRLLVISLTRGVRHESSI